jgi:prepilin-type N-terminal cleavage/methylation domain-containing protein
MSRGFSLVEVLVSMAVISSATVAIAGLPLLAMRANESARRTTIAAALAAQKMEQLQSAAWSELQPSPASALERNSPGYCDFLDGDGRVLGAGVSPPPGADSVRRWSLEAAASAPLLIIQVAVVPVSRDEPALRSRRHPEEVRIVGVKSRG